jgi:CheY-like chemotaxis protein
MPTHPALSVVEALADAARSIGMAASDGPLRAQAAFVRALVDEVARHHPSEPHVAALHDQLGEELTRMADLVPSIPRRDLEADDDVSVLVVDDDLAALRAMSSVVTDFGLEHRLAADANEALAALEARPASIVVTDWSMPGMSGLELCRTLKRRDHHVYTILVTAHDDVRSLQDVRGWVDDYLPKPVDLDELAQRLRAAVRLVRAMRTARSLQRRLAR